MKLKIFTLLLIALFYSNELFSQIGFYATTSNYKNTGEATFENIETRNSQDLGIRYNFQFSDAFGLNAGIFRTERISDTDFYFAPAKVNEENINLPIMLTYGFPIGEKTRMQMALGGNISTPAKQEVLFPKNTIIPQDIETEHGFGQYYKFGIISTFGIKHQVSEKISLLINAHALREYEGMSVTNEDKPAFFYFSRGWEAGIEFRLK